MDTTTLSNLIDSIYGAGLGEDSWHAVVAKIADAFGEQNGVLYEFDSRSRRSTMLGSTAIDPQMMKTYEQYYAGIDDWNRRGIVGELNVAAATHDLISDGEFEKTEFCADYLRRLDLFYGMGAVARREGTRTTLLGLQRARRRGHYSKSEVRAIELLVHHVGRSLAISERVGKVSMPGLSPSSSSGVVVLQADGRVAFVAEATLQPLAAAGLTVRNGVLVAEPGAAAALELLKRQLAGAARRERNVAIALDLPLEGGAELKITGARAAATGATGDGRLVCLVVELRSPPMNIASQLQRRYKLTASEAALAAALADGRTLADIAEHKRVSINTLRVQLQAIFAKTGCHRQTDLVRLILRLPRA